MSGPKEDGNRLVTVCEDCFTASCWYGEVMCDRPRGAGLTKRTRSELDAMGLESPDNYSDAKLMEMCGVLETKLSGTETKRPLLSHLMGSHNEATWNAAHPVGTRVRYWPILPPIDSAPPLDTTTRSEAWTLGDGSVVVKVVGRSGGVHLGHLELIGSPKPWDHGAVYYDTGDGERLTHETLDKCLEAELDYHDTIEEAVSRSVTVHAWVRDEIDVDYEAKTHIDNLIESMSIAISDEYGDPDGNSEDIFGAEAEEAFRTALAPAVRALLETVTVWRCSIIGERTFTASELMEWVKKNNPKWLEGKS